ncbi:MAG: site-2 protease family protein [Pirellulales bacterium]
MLLQEPPYTRYDLHFSLAGVPVRVHPLFWLVAFFMSVRDGLQQVQWQPLVISMGVLFFSILIHEFGHALAYRRFHYEPRIVLHWLGGLATADMTYSVSPPRGKRLMRICLAGPIAGFVLAAVTVAVLFAIGRQIDFMGWTVGRGQPFEATSVGYNLYTLFYSLLFVNVLWGLVNLLPVFPLDGGQISREAFQMRLGGEGVLTALKLSMVVAILTAVVFFLWLGFKDGLFPLLLFGSLAYGNYREAQFLIQHGQYGDDDEGESWRRGRGDREW